MNTKLTSSPSIPAINSAILLIASLLIMHTASAQTLAGKVVFAQGAPVAINTEGTERGLARGNEIFSGDRLITTTGRVQLSMIDGAFVSVQPNSEYQIENYNYSGTPDGTEIANYRLVKGGVRAVTGLIGRQNPEAYKVNTAVATIGIRGTGHNTRICAGDCGGRRDGLYHQTWEGITFVVNDVDTQDVPTGMGVFVADIDTDIEVLDQPPAVLAVETTKKRQEEGVEEAEEETRVVSSGEQRDETGDQQIVADVRGRSTVITNFGGVGVLPDFESEGIADIFGFQFDSSLFLRDSDDAAIAILGTEFARLSGGAQLTLATIDVAAVRGGNNADEVRLAESLLSLANPALLTSLEESPASVAEFFFNEEIGFGRWADGRVLVVHDADNVADNEIIELSGFQSLHYLFGKQAPTLPTSASASYEFFGGTQSTSFSGDTIGEGVVDGFIDVFFGDSSAFLEMDVDHNNVDYFVSGNLSILGNTLSDIFDGSPSVYASGGVCDLCRTFIDGGFLGPAQEGFPKYIGLEYDIQTPDVIMGVAAFGFVPEPEPIVTSTVLSGPGLVGVTGDEEAPDSVNAFIFEFGSALFLRDSDEKGIAVLGLEDDDEVANFQTLATVDVAAVRGGNNATEVAFAETFLALADPALLSSLEESPASVAEFFYNQEIGFGRWADGRVLVLHNSPNNVDNEIIELTGSQSIHFVFGTEPPALPLTSIATYNFFGGTQSTSVSGSTIGLGVTGGQIDVNFATGNAGLDMTVNHDSIDYSVSGLLTVDPMDNALFDMDSVFANGGACASCITYIDGGVVGPGTGDYPKYLVLEYDIQDTDVIMGVAAFNFGSSITTQALTNSIFIGVGPDSETPGFVDIIAGINATIFIDDNQLVGVLFSEEDDISPFDIFRTFASVDPDKVLAGDDFTSVNEVQTLLDTADAATVDTFKAGTPATIADSQFFPAFGFGWGRWTNGLILSTDVNTSDPLDPQETDAGGVTGNESVHYIFGQDPGLIATSGSASYNFVGGTQSTTESGATLGNGVTGGSIAVDFGLGSGSINMTVDHIPSFPYTVSGSLNVVPALNQVYDMSVMATTADSGSACFSTGCPAFIDGGFAGPTNSGIPDHLGIEYDIQDSDIVMGVAGFAKGP